MKLFQSIKSKWSVFLHYSLAVWLPACWWWVASLRHKRLNIANIILNTIKGRMPLCCVPGFALQANPLKPIEGSWPGQLRFSSKLISGVPALLKNLLLFLQPPGLRLPVCSSHLFLLVFWLLKLIGHLPLGSVELLLEMLPREGFLFFGKRCISRKAVRESSQIIYGSS